MSKDVNKKLLKIIVEEAVNLVQKEGVEDEDQALAFVDKIKLDALLANPTTDAGRLVREKALGRLDGVESPYVKPSFNYKEHRDKTTNAALVQVLKELGKYNNLVMKDVESDEDRERLEKDYDKCSFEILQIMIKFKTPMKDYKYFFDSLIAVIRSLEQSVVQQVEGHRAEALSRLFGAKNPGTGKYDMEHATYDDLLRLRERALKETGNKLSDYHHFDGEEEVKEDKDVSTKKVDEKKKDKKDDKSNNK